MKTHWQLRWLRFKLQLGFKYNHGICYQVNAHRYFHEWPKFSGVPWHPVPAPNGKTAQEATDAYNKFKYNKHAMWSKTHPYGKLRLELLDFLIERTK